jgi:hypothetical protein
MSIRIRGCASDSAGPRDATEQRREFALVKIEAAAPSFDVIIRAELGPFPSHSRIRQPVQPCRGRLIKQL